MIRFEEGYDLPDPKYEKWVQLHANVHFDDEHSDVEGDFAHPLLIQLTYMHISI